MRSKLAFFVLSICFGCADLRAQDAGTNPKVLEDSAKAWVRSQSIRLELSISQVSDRPVILRTRLLSADGGEVDSRKEKLQPRQTKLTQLFALPKDIPEEKVPWLRAQYSLEVDGKDVDHGILALGALDKGLYQLTVAHPRTVTPGQRFSARILALNPVTQAVVPGIRLVAILELDGSESSTRTLTHRIVTNKNGEAQVVFNVPKADISDATLQVGDEARRQEFNGANDDSWDPEVSTDLGISKLVRLLLQTDKQLYQPGQTMHLRALAFGTDRHALADAALTVAVSDEKQQNVSKQKVTTNRFGVAAFDWKIGDRAKLGEYKVEAECDCGDSAPGAPANAVFTVSRYELPEFTVEGTADKTYYLPGQKPEVHVRARYLFGKPVSGAHVRLIREEESTWDSVQRRLIVKAADERTASLDANGDASFAPDVEEIFKQLGDASYDRFRDVQMVAYVTDASTGRTEQRRFSIRLAKDPIHIYLLHTDGDSRDGEYLLTTQYADGAPAKCRVVVQQVIASPTGDKTASERRTEVARAETSRYGLAKLRLRFPTPASQQNTIAVSLYAEDREGRKATFDDSLYFWRDQAALWLSTDQSLLAPGDPIRMTLHAPSARPVDIDVVKDGYVLTSMQVRAREGTTSIFIPSEESFHGELGVRAYSMRDVSEWAPTAVKRVLYPEDRDLKVQLTGLATTYRPGDLVAARLRISSSNGDGNPAVLGVAVTDKAVDERIRTEQQFARTLWNWNWDDYIPDVAGVTRQDLDKVDVSRPVSPDFDLVAETILNYGGDPSFEVERPSNETIRYQFENSMKNGLDSLVRALATTQPELPWSDSAALKRVAKEHGISPEIFLDSWGTEYRPKLNLEITDYVLRFESAGPDKKFGTDDDFSIEILRQGIFAPYSGKLLAALHDANSHGELRTGEDWLRTIAKSRGLDLAAIRDPWNHPYRYETVLSGRWLHVVVYTEGPPSSSVSIHAPLYFFWRSPNGYRAWDEGIDYFSGNEERVSRAVREWIAAGHPFPRSKDEFLHACQTGGFDFNTWRDPAGNPYRVEFPDGYINSLESRISNANQEVSATSTPVTRGLHKIDILRSGVDAQSPSFDTQVAELVQPFDRQSGRDLQAEPVNEGTFRGNTGAIGGTVTDFTGAVIGGATLRIASGIFTATAKTDANGRFLFRDLRPGLYSINGTAPGFQTMEIRDVFVSSSTLTRVDLTLNVAAMSQTVEVTAEQTTTATEEAQVATVVDRGTRRVSTASGTATIQMLDFTPRVRQDFQETAYWSPSLETNAAGTASLRFKLSDNLTTWKLVAFASTIDGKLGSVEREFQSFQPFFVDLDTPPILTVGDQISLPVVLRNYGKAAATMNVSVAPAAWLKLLGNASQTSMVPANGSSRVTFAYEAAQAIDAGKQRVTARNHSDGDAVEKPVRVHPDGQQRFITAADLVGSSRPLSVVVPKEMIQGSLHSDLVVYPDIAAHVAKAIEGVLRRPYGCAEQTISSTYPSVLLLQLLEGSGRSSPLIRRARKYVQDGYDKLTGYFASSGGVAYWGDRDIEPDPDLTAYALEFLRDASAYVDVDPKRLQSARDWLINNADDGSWHDAHGLSYEGSDLFIVAALLDVHPENDTPAQQRKINEMARTALKHASQSAIVVLDPYTLAQELRIATALKDQELISRLRTKLLQMAVHDSSGVHWDLDNLTPFSGWGTSGELETTAMVTRAIEGSCHPGGCADATQLLNEAMYFLLRHKDADGVWYSGQATVQVLKSLLPVAREQLKTQDANNFLRVRINGIELDSSDLAALQPDPDVLDAPRSLDLSKYVREGDNRIEFNSGGAGKFAAAQIVTEYYVPWKDRSRRQQTQPGLTSGLDYGTSCETTSLRVGEEVECHVGLRRFGKNSWGMLLAEVGLPPGAEVDRAGLAKLLKADILQRYELQPDRIVFYLWSPPAEGKEFSFQFRLRYPVDAQSAPSELVDYYNPDLKVVLPPERFRATQ